MFMAENMFMAGTASIAKAPYLVEPGVGIREALEVLGAHGRIPWEVARLRGRGRIVDAAALRVGRQHHCMTHCSLSTPLANQHACRLLLLFAGQGCTRLITLPALDTSSCASKARCIPLPSLEGAGVYPGVSWAICAGVRCML